MTRLPLQITREDICNAERCGINNAILYVLSRATQTLWRISDCGCGLEVTPPHRTFLLRKEVIEAWHAYESTSGSETFDLVLELHDLEAVADQSEILPVLESCSA